MSGDYNDHHARRAAVQSHRAEFDDYADGYDAGHGNPIKRLVGSGPEDFVELKARWLLRHLEKVLPTRGEPRLLDFGCGLATLLKLLRRLGFRGRLEGCDVSAAMLERAAATWQAGAPPPLRQIAPGQPIGYADRSFDVVVLSAVLHHVPPPDRPEIYADLVRLLTPGGRLVVFEHNPFNPVTTFVVKRTPIDRDAILLRPSEVRSALAAAGLSQLVTRYLMFFPPRFRFLRSVEDVLGWMPLGGQYAVSGAAEGAG
jgi:SAM-dependent methyltransferase